MSDTLIERPQPIGIFPLPAGYLLLPPTEDRAAATALMVGRLPEAWPDEWQFFADALAGNTEAALASLKKGPLAPYNRFILAPSHRHHAEAMTVPELQMMTQVAAYSLGFLEEPPVGDLDGELLAFALAAHAAHALLKAHPASAIHLLTAAVSAARPASPLLAAQLLGQLAALLRDDPVRSTEAAGLYEEAIRLVGDTPLVRLKAELWFALGAAYQEQANDHRGMLLQAAKAYQKAIHCGLSTEVHPDLYAEVQNNLALTYLAIPAVSASDQLRMAVAIQSLREALKVYTRESHPERWASTTLNLANALQYLPSGHPAENLMQAVDLYEEVMEVRTRPSDPLGYARVLANQANALAHLGMFAPALVKLGEAHKLFHWHDDPDAAASVLELVERIAQCRAPEEPAKV